MTCKLKEIDVISDIHFNHHIKDVTLQKAKNFIKNYLMPTDYDPKVKRPVICLAGDIFDKHESCDNIFKAFKMFYEEVVYVYGNHECYVYSKNIQSTEEKLDYIRRSAKTNGIHMLEGDICTIQGVTFGGSSAWYDFTYGYKYNETNKSMYQMFLNYMSDSVLVADYFTYPNYWGKRQPVLNFNAFLEKRLQEVKRIPESVDVMLTHVGPCVPKSLVEKYKEPSTGFYFFNGEEEVIRIQPKIWLYGHTHQTYDEVFYKTRLVCNPFGYPSEKPQRIKTIQLEGEI